MIDTAATAFASWHMWAVFALVAVTIVGFATERVPMEVTATLLLAALLVLFAVAPLTAPDGRRLMAAEDILRGFGNPGLITVVALLVVGQGLIQTGALESVSAVMLRLSGGRLFVAMAMSLIPVMILSSVLNNTPVVVIFIPIMSALAEKLGASSTRVLIPLSYAAILGGMTTLIGSSTNLLVAGVVRELGMPPIGFFDFVVPGAFLALVGIAYLLTVAPRLLPHRAALARQVAGAGRQFIAQIAVDFDSPLIGEKAVSGMFRRLPDVTVRLIQRGEHAFLPPFEGVSLAAGDVIVVAATRKALTEALSRHGEALHPSLTHRQFSRELDREDEARRADAEQALAEVMVGPGSRMIGSTLETFGFRHQFHCIVLGVQRRSRMIRQKMTEIRLEAGDVLLIQGPPDDVRALRASRDVVLIEWSQESLPRYVHARRAALIFAVMIAVAAFELVPIVVAAVAAAAAMLLTDCLNARQAARAIDRAVVMTIGATLALGAALEVTGGAAYIAHHLATTLAGVGPAVLLSALFLAVAVMTNVLSNNASAVLFTPIAVNLAIEADVDPIAFVHAVIFAASCSFASPVGYQTNLLVMAPGHYRFADYLRAGAPLVLLLWACFSLLSPFYYDLSR